MSDIKFYIYMNEGYWKKFYEDCKKDKDFQINSSFAEFCLSFIPENMKIIDVGCGSGRDTYYFIKNSFNCIGIDREAPVKEFFIKDNFLNHVNDEAVYYSRFFLHSISNEEILSFLSKANGYFMAECRSIGDNPLLYRNHDRNLIDGNWLLMSLIDNGFEVIYYQKAYGLAKFNEEDPYVIRVIARKLKKD